MSPNGILSILEVNALPTEQFEWLFGNVIEHCPEAAGWVATKRPFLSTESLRNAFDDYLDKLKNHEKENVLIKHPDLAGKLAEEGKLTTESQNEQKCAGLDEMTREEKQTLANLNAMYKEKFHFPFVICARENKVAAILSGIENRLNNSPETELEVGIQEVKKICRIRLLDVVWSDAR
ncbi:2-oxo-4-hydroxy-4-carboxy-5-ureidoimidazoline decarboxylase-like isoform X1 [Neodiprion pinetum]|uniref:2-oxo-4-hydroxy-4-carboxy-5-ureidoimidazoline decarboxylase-like isoform X1 n=1 Tax=Neodiprion pinetum TaxID=441929 RepID=UPI00076FAA70|nr:2-oxo-4-hydroxy-4-carboxy-5-ureidoimidazoline decarboxylase-like isoform X1 [Neodiprion pinetum]XP_046489034.1 2-oxo-4-hydroxy-4-carboxy-5-ureidoimidazoline decarboxylase-like isoform X1 [Neodiprion pinetum]XP_046489035.1 2-oxo-4-hydroxy-4-carboxy-5-ureidoimidazoline decarboxylase-like isoform X1 [Neodiprion pinetum]XP_046625994.1 2-oxo-4-hydroxy-4-carboxy-5-ureidoimidazoline decarboxylase-like isoform X1 [Neodiprion virginianus]XP_046625995.1 2-oxo-4-hydroxy-4-carboxy-5-ureidoimidazoline de